MKVKLKKKQKEGKMDSEAQGNIFLHADNIVNNRSEERERQYGPFSEGMENAAKIFNGITGLNFTAREMFFAIIALKLSREGYSHKYDNLLDCISYIGGLNNYENEQEKL